MAVCRGLWVSWRMDLLLPRERAVRRRSKVTPQRCREKQTTTSDTQPHTWVTSSSSCDPAVTGSDSLHVLFCASCSFSWPPPPRKKEKRLQADVTHSEGEVWSQRGRVEVFKDGVLEVWKLQTCRQTTSAGSVNVMWATNESLVPTSDGNFPHIISNCKVSEQILSQKYLTINDGQFDFNETQTVYWTTEVSKEHKTTVLQSITINLLVIGGNYLFFLL